MGGAEQYTGLSNGTLGTDLHQQQQQKAYTFNVHPESTKTKSSQHIVP
jgi:hypothetical protein